MSDAREVINDAAAMIRKSIDRQIATTPPGKMLGAAHPREVAELTANIVGNLAYGVLEFAHAAVEAALEAALVDERARCATAHATDRAEIRRLDDALAEARAEHARFMRAAQSIADRAPRPLPAPGGIERCTSCGTPTHPTMSDDLGRCAQCSNEANEPSHNAGGM